MKGKKHQRRNKVPQLSPHPLYLIHLGRSNRPAIVCCLSMHDFEKNEWPHRVISEISYDKFKCLKLLYPEDVFTMGCATCNI